MTDSATIRELFDDFTSLYGSEILYDQSRNLAYVCILKNAHSWSSQLFIDNLDCEKISSVPKKTKTVVILRHPISRWASGFAQFMTEYDEAYISLIDDPKFQRIAFDVVQWDNHTSRQIDSIATLELQDCLFFKCNGDLEQNLIHYLSSVKGVSPEEVINNNMYNRSDGGGIRPIINRKLQKLINSNSVFKKKLLDYYHPDMQLIAYINEHNLWYSPNTNT